MGLLKVVVQYGLVRVLWHGNVERCVMWNEVPRVWADTARYMVVEVGVVRNVTSGGMY